MIPENTDATLMYSNIKAVKFQQTAFLALNYKLDRHALSASLKTFQTALNGGHSTKKSLLKMKGFLQMVITCNVAQFGIFANLVGGAGANGAAVDVDDGFLPHVEPDDGSILWPFVSASFFNGLDEAFLGGLTAAKDLVARDAAEVGHTVNLVGQLLDLFKVIQHGRGLGYVTTANFRHLDL